MILDDACMAIYIATTLVLVFMSDMTLLYCLDCIPSCETRISLIDANGSVRQKFCHVIQSYTPEETIITVPVRQKEHNALSRIPDCSYSSTEYSSILKDVVGDLH